MRKWQLIAIVAAWFVVLAAITRHGQRPHVLARPAVVALTGQGWLDTLAVLALRRPSVDTMPDVYKTLGILGWAPPDSVSLYLAQARERHWGMVTHSEHGITWTRVEVVTPLEPAEARGIAAHEFGHELSYARPDLFTRFRSLGATPEAGGFAAEETITRMENEAFADAFAQAVCRRGPTCFEKPYFFSPAITNDAQRALVDSAVAARWGAL
jgi:hypothetical protein